MVEEEKNKYINKKLIMDRFYMSTLFVFQVDFEIEQVGWVSHSDFMFHTIAQFDERDLANFLIDKYEKRRERNY